MAGPNLYYHESLGVGDAAYDAMVVLGTASSVTPVSLEASGGTILLDATLGAIIALPMGKFGVFHTSLTGVPGASTADVYYRTGSTAPTTTGVNDNSTAAMRATLMLPAGGEVLVGNRNGKNQLWFFKSTAALKLELRPLN